MCTFNFVNKNFVEIYFLCCQTSIYTIAPFFSWFTIPNIYYTALYTRNLLTILFDNGVVKTQRCALGGLAAFAESLWAV